jgi:hypothetical protein
MDRERVTEQRLELEWLIGLDTITFNSNFHRALGTMMPQPLAIR